MKTALICTVTKDAQAHLQGWYDRLIALAAFNPDWEITLSVCDRGSMDGTSELLKQYETIYDNPIGGRFFVKSDPIATAGQAEQAALAGFNRLQYSKMLFVDVSDPYEPFDLDAI